MFFNFDFYKSKRKQVSFIEIKLRRSQIRIMDLVPKIFSSNQNLANKKWNVFVIVYGNFKNFIIFNFILCSDAGLC